MQPEIPSPDDLKRDLDADLALCGATTPGPWRNGQIDDHPDAPSVFAGRYQPVIDDRFIRGDYCMSFADAEFVAIARSAWPVAIRRARYAEPKAEMFDRLTEAACALSETRPEGNSVVEALLDQIRRRKVAEAELVVADLRIAELQKIVDTLTANAAERKRPE
jgi:hypothetical protein